MIEEVENLIRSLYIPQLKVLEILAESEEGISTNKEIGDTTSTATSTLGALITPLRRRKVNGKTLIVPAGRDLDGSMRWQLNKELIPQKEELKRLLVEMGI